MSITGTVPPRIRHFNDIGDVNVPAPVDGYFVYWDAAAGKWQCQHVVTTVDHLNNIGDVNVPAPTDQYFIYWDAAAGRWQCRALIDADIPASIARDAEVAAVIAAHIADASAHHIKTGNDEVYGLFRVGLDVNRPAAGVAERFYWATDTKILYYDTGVAWVEATRGETVTRLAQLAERAHSSLTGIGSADHHAKYTDAEAKAQAEATKLDDHAAPDDNTDLDATAALHGLMAKADKSKLDGIEDSAVALATVKADADVSDAIAKKHTQGTDTALGAVGIKATPVNADKLLQRNSAAGDALVTSTWTQIKAFLKTYWDTLYEALGAVATHAGLTTGVHGVGASYIAKSSIDGLDLAYMFRILPATFYEWWKTWDGWTESLIGSGSTTIVALCDMRMSTGATINSRATRYSGAGMTHPQATNVRYLFAWFSTTTAFTNAEARIYVVEITEATGPLVDTDNHAGFKIINGNVYATNADGTTEKATDLGLDWESAWEGGGLEIRGTGSSIEYYVNAVLKATHTENLPTANWNYRVVLEVTNQVAADRGLRFRPIAGMGVG